MAEIKGKHPNWFKMKIERRELIRQLSPETAVNVLLACWDFLETGEKPAGMSPIESIAFASFMPDMDEAWNRYIQRITAKSNRTISTDTDRPHTTSTETEEETEPETEPETKKEIGADKPPIRSRFVPPTVEEVRAYCLERGNGIDPSLFVDFYEARGWIAGRGKMRSWKAAVRTWEKRNASAAEENQPATRRTGHLTVDENGEEVVRFD